MVVAISGEDPSPTAGAALGRIGTWQHSARSRHPIKLAAAALITIPVAIIFFVFRWRIGNASGGAVKE